MKDITMITLTRLNGKQFVLNAELIRTVESSPDTMVTLVNGDHFVVKEEMQEVVDAAIRYGQTLRGLLPPS
jgi:flagellar protein FlbD